MRKSPLIGIFTIILTALTSSMLYSSDIDYDDLESRINKKISHRQLKIHSLDFLSLLKNYSPSKIGDASESKEVIEICLNSRSLYLEASRFGELYPNDMWLEDVRPIILELHEIVLNQKLSWIKSSNQVNPEIREVYESVSKRYMELLEFQGGNL